MAEALQLAELHREGIITGGLMMPETLLNCCRSFWVIQLANSVLITLNER
jgi:hypothetical protein